MRALSLANSPVARERIPGLWRPVVCLTAVGIAALLPAILFGIPSNIDLSNHFRFALPFYESIQNGHWYPGWLAQSNAGFGDPSFRFYPPALYYLLALARMFTGSWYTATLSVFALLSVTGVVGAYFWARQFLTSQVAVWAGIFYAVAPYHLNQLYQACMLAEFAGAAVLPFVLAFTERVCRRGRNSDVAGLAASLAVLVLTHLPLAVISSLALFVYALLRTSKNQTPATLMRLALAFALGLAASSCYWMTMVAELHWIRADSVKPDPSVDFRRNFIFSTFSPENLNIWWMNILVFASIALFWPCLMIFRRSSHRPGSLTVARAVALLALFSLLMTTPLTRPLWTVLSPLQHVQFPWRWLAITSLAGSLALASAIPLWSTIIRGKMRPLALLAAGTILVSVAFSLSHTVREARYLDPTQFETTRSEIPGSLSVSQWWPVWVNEPWKEMQVPVDAGARSVSVRSWEPEKRIFQVSAGDAAEARVRTFYYPHWAATAGNKSLPVRPDGDGALLIAVPANETFITLEFREPPRVYWAAVLTVLGWIAITILAGSGIRKWLIQGHSLRSVFLHRL
ncbi:MAG: 6-pyruvoyl-tetrahydropterin synthase-related protein [Pyrinomonadaceae bacterium]